MEQTKKEKPSRNSKKRPASHYLKYTGIVFQMGATIATGAFSGRWLDNYFDLPKPYLTIVLSLFAIFGGFYLIIKDLTKDD